jgi:prepilin-type N-terminal cleavage/methylation domain-containing protein
MKPNIHTIAFRARASAQRGFTLLELMIGVVVLLMLVGSLMQSLRTMTRGATYAGIDGELQAQAEHALRSIIASLKPSGFAIVGGNRYPYLFQDGNAMGAFLPSAHAPATHHAIAGQPDFGPNQEIVFVQPADANADNRPDLDGAGQMIWAGNQYAFVVVTRPDGTNVLQRRIDGGSIREIANHIERITFDDNTSSGFVVPLRAIRVRIWLREQDERGAIHRYFTEAVVKLRNG